MKKGAVIWAIIGILIIGLGIWGIMNYNLPNNPGNDENKTYCDEKSRSVGYCIQVYSPVCGWMGPNVQCIKYPCAGNYSNSCEACHNENVEYYTPGECPK